MGGGGGALIKVAIHYVELQLRSHGDSVPRPHTSIVEPELRLANSDEGTICVV